MNKILVPAFVFLSCVMMGCAGNTPIAVCSTSDGKQTAASTQNVVAVRPTSVPSSTKAIPPLTAQQVRARERALLAQSSIVSDSEVDESLPKADAPGLINPYVAASADETMGTPAQTLDAPPVQTPPDSVPAPTLPPTSTQELGAKVENSTVILTTKFGKIYIALDAQAAPKTVANFKKLVTDGFYNQTTFHRVIPDFMIQGGDPNSKGSDRSTHGQGGPGYTVPAEIGLKNTRGAVAMARLPDEVNPQKDSSGSQFFICVADAPFLDGGYTVFGHVTKGMEVVDQIVAQKRDARDNPVEKIEMQAALAPAAL